MVPERMEVNKNEEKNDINIMLEESEGLIELCVKMFEYATICGQILTLKNICRDACRDPENPRILGVIFDIIVKPLSYGLISSAINWYCPQPITSFITIIVSLIWGTSGLIDIIYSIADRFSKLEWKEVKEVE